MPSAACLYVCLKVIYILFKHLVSNILLVVIYRPPQSLVAQRFPDLKVETKSWQGGKIFGVRRKPFHTKAERFSRIGGSIFVVGWKDFHGQVEAFSY